MPTVNDPNAIEEAERENECCWVWYIDPNRDCSLLAEFEVEIGKVSVGREDESVVFGCGMGSWRYEEYF